MIGYTKSFNKLSETVSLKSVSSPTSVFHEIIQNASRDLVFVCDGGVMLSYHTEIVANLSSLVRNILSLENFGPAKFFTPKNSQIFVTLAEVNPVTLRIIMDSLYNRDVVNFSSFNSVGIQAVVKMLGVGEELFSVSETNQNVNIDVDDSKIVDVISDLMEEFGANPNDLQEIMASNIEDGFLTELSEASTIMGGNDSFFGLENLMAEHGDENLSFDDATVEETVQCEVAGDKLSVSFQDDLDIPDIGTHDRTDAFNDLTKKCVVEISNIPTETLKHYINIAQDKSSKRRPEAEEADVSKRKKRKHLEDSLEREEIEEVVVDKNEFTTNEGEASEPAKINLIPVINRASNPPPGPPIPVETPIPITKSNESTEEIQFIEAKQVSCMICDEVFKVRSKIIQHLCVNHFSNQIFALYPFVKGGNCPLCVKAGKPKVIVLKDKNSHVRHIGQTHEIIFEIITPEFKECIDQFTKTSRRGAPPKYRVKEEKVEVSEPLEESNSSFQESPEDNYLKLLKDFTENYEKQSEVNNKTAFIATTEETVQSESVLSDADQSLVDKYCSEMDKDRPVEESESLSATLACNLCPDPQAFNFREHLLIHLSNQHLSKEILSLYPFQEGTPCELCSSVGNPDSFSSSSQEYADHIGTFHEKVLDLLPTEYCEKMDALQKTKGKGSNSSKLETSNFKPNLNSTFVDTGVELLEDESDFRKADSDCELCYLTGASSRAELLLHYSSKHFQQQILSSHPFQESLPCKACVETRQPKAFVAKNLFRYLKHLGVVHEKALIFMSSVGKEKMERKFSNQKKVRNLSPEAFGASMKNVIISTTGVAFNCKLCVKSFSTEDELNSHKSSHKEGKNYNCRYCGVTCDNAKQFKLHLLSHKNELSRSKLV